MPEVPSLEQVTDLVINGYVPFAEIPRAIPWPNNVSERNENDAEHSFGLALVASSVAQELGLDPSKACQFAVVHDFVERFADDTSVWDEEGALTKVDREAAALVEIKDRWAHFPWLFQTIEEYDRLDSEEACLVYALDKLLAVLMITAGDGYFWRTSGITFEQHEQKAKEVGRKIARHPLVHDWYQQQLEIVSNNRDLLFT